jgi:hypothetical protein
MKIKTVVIYKCPFVAIYGTNGEPKISGESVIWQGLKVLTPRIHIWRSSNPKFLVTQWQWWAGIWLSNILSNQRSLSLHCNFVPVSCRLFNLCPLPPASSALRSISNDAPY